MSVFLVRRLAIRTAYIGIAVFLTASLLPGNLFAAEEPSDWFTGNPELHNVFDIGQEALPYSINGNRNCNKQRIVTKPEKFVPFFPFYFAEESHESCVVNTGYGAVSQSGYLQVAGETVFGRVMYPNGSSLHLLPAPRSPNAIYMTSNPPNGMGLFLITDMLSNLTGTTLGTGEREYRLKSDFTSIPLKDRFGNRVGVQTDSISFSNNGAWMVADIPFVGLARINTASFGMTVFDVPFNYFVGVAPGVQSAITNNGRYVSVGSRSFTRLGLYDLEDCSTPSTCQRKDLWKFFKDKDAGFDGAARLRFSSDYSLRMYLVTKLSVGQKVERATLAAAGHAPTDFEYLALGDSFASGEGAYQYKAATDAGPNKCHLSLLSYPYLIADELGINEMESIACSGAVIEDIINMSEEYGGQVRDNLIRREREEEQIFENFEPGYIAQLEFIHKYNPSSLSISTFGNDIGFGNKIKRCLEPDTCYSSYEDRLEIIHQINNQFGRLTEMYTNIKEEMEGKKVYVLGYPSLAADGGNCALNVRLNAEEIVFSNQLVRYLNAVIKNAADKIGFYYVDVENALAGHRLCEAHGSAIAVNGLTSGNDFVNIPFTDFDGPVANESFHPNALGHELYAETILEKTDNLTKPMPSPNLSAAYPVESAGLELLLNAPKANRQLNRVNYDDDLGNDVALRQGWWDGYIELNKWALKQNSLFSVWLHSEPAQLGTFTTSASGDTSFAVQIPENTPAGFHTIHVYGTSFTGEPVDIQKVIYVAHAENDTDGDGVLNSAETCGLGPATGVDQDKDGIDDACDGYIDDPPSEPEDNKIPVSNGDPKPPENNPETVAGDEQLPPDEQAVQVLSADSNAYAISPYQTPYEEDSTPQVAADTDEKSSTANSDTQTQPSVTIGIPADRPGYWLLFVFLAAVTFAAGVLYQRNKR